MVKLLMIYLIYQGMLHIESPPADKTIFKKELYKKFFFPAIQMSPLLETAGQH